MAYGIDGGTAAVDDPATHGRHGRVALERGEQYREPAAFDGRVLIEQDEHRGGGTAGRLVHGCREAHVSLVSHEAEVRELAAETFRDRDGSILRSVVDNHELVLGRRDIHPRKGFEA